MDNLQPSTLKVCSSSTKSWLTFLGLRYSQTSLEKVQDNIIHFYQKFILQKNGIGRSIKV